MTRIRQFAKDMSISYDKAKKLVDKGKSLVKMLLNKMQKQLKK